MIYFFNTDMQLVKVVTSKNVLYASHEQELNGVIISDIEMDLDYSKGFLDDVDLFGYYYKDNFYLHHIQRIEDAHGDDIVNVHGRHVFFNDMMYGQLIEDVRPQNRTAQDMLVQTIQENTRWDIVMNGTTGTLSTNFYWQTPYEVLEWIVNTFRLEYEPYILFDGQKVNGYQIRFYKKIGNETGIRIPFGDRVVSLTHEIDYSEIVTRLAVRGKGEETEDGGYGRRINLKDIHFSRDGVVSPVGDYYLENTALSDEFENPRHAELILEDIEDVDELAEEGYQAYLDMSRPKMNFEASVQDIGDVNIGDSVWIIRHEHEMYYSARVQVIRVDLLNPSDAEVEIGDYQHFKETKAERVSRRERENLQSENRRIDGELAQIRENYNQVINDVSAEINNAKTDMRTQLNERLQQFSDEFDIDNYIDIDSLRVRVLDMSDADAHAVFNKLTALDVFVETIKGIDLEFSEADISYLHSQLIETAVIKASQVEMDTAFFNKLVGSENSLILSNYIKAQDIEMDKLKGGDIELSRGIRITNNGNVVMEVTSDGQFRFDATAAGVATKEEISNLEAGTRNLILASNFCVSKAERRFNLVEMPLAGRHVLSLDVELENASTGTQSRIGYEIGVTYTDGTQGLINIWYTLPSENHTYKGRQYKNVNIPKDVASIRYASVYANFLTGDTVKACKPMLSRGTVKSGYIEAPEDNIKRIDEIELIPGPPGEDGHTPVKGVDYFDGKDGASSYTHIRYSANADGSNRTLEPTPDTKYIGIVATDDPIAPSNATDYNWSLMPQNISTGIKNYFSLDTQISGTASNIRREKGPNFYGLLATGAGDGLSYIQLDDIFEGAGRYVVTWKMRTPQNAPHGITITTHERTFKRFNKSLEYNEFEYFWCVVDVEDISVNNYLRFDRLSWVYYEIDKVMVAKSDVPVDWKPADVDYERYVDEGLSSLRTYVNDVQTNQLEFERVLAEKQSISEFERIIREITDVNRVEKERVDNVLTDVNTLLERTTSMTNILGEQTATWQFIATNITFGEEGTYIHDASGNSGVRIGKDRIDFISGGEVVQYISDQQLYVMRSIAVQSMRVGYHEDVALNENSTLTRWVGA